MDDILNFTTQKTELAKQLHVLLYNNSNFKLQCFHCMFNVSQLLYLNSIITIHWDNKFYILYAPTFALMMLFQAKLVT